MGEELRREKKTRIEGWNRKIVEDKSGKER